MDIGRISEKVMGMDDATWERHSNPISGWTRVTILPLLAFAIWSRVWLGWHALWIVRLSLVWTWLNPRLFGPPATNDAWMTQGVLGERIWLAKTTHPIPDHHARVSRWLNIAAGISVLILAKGLLSLDLGFTIAGLIGAMGAKLWFLDRMVWLRHDMEPTASPE
jgi:hypothetical protein